MFDLDEIDRIIVRGDFGKDLLPYQVSEVIDQAISEEVLSRAVGGMQPDEFNILLTLSLSDEVTIVTQPIGVREFIEPGDSTKRSGVIFALTKAVELLTEIHDAATQSRQADWKQISILKG
jgi:hypothetical protein